MNTSFVLITGLFNFFPLLCSGCAIGPNDLAFFIIIIFTVLRQNIQDMIAILIQLGRESARVCRTESNHVNVLLNEASAHISSEFNLKGMQEENVAAQKPTFSMRSFLLIVIHLLSLSLYFSRSFCCSSICRRRSQLA